MELWIVCGVIIAVCVILHPPDDGTREEHFDDEP